MLLLSSVHMLPDVLHLLLGQGLQQVVGLDADPGLAFTLPAATKGSAGTPLDHELAEKAERGVDVKVMGWISRTATQPSLIGNAGFLPTWTWNAATMLSIIDLRQQTVDGHHPLARSVCAFTGAHPFGAAHLKLVVASDGSKPVAFIGGMDLMESRKADEFHKAGFWHDLQLKVQGGVATDMYEFYKMLWHDEVYLGKRDTFTYKRRFGAYTDAPSVVDATELIPDRAKDPGFATAPKKSKAHRAALVRTLPTFNLTKALVDLEAVVDSLQMKDLRTRALDLHKDGLFEIKVALKKAVGAAESYVYMEDQYFHSQEVMKWLHDAVSAPDSRLKVLLVYGGKLDPSDTSTHHQAPERLQALSILRQGLSDEQLRRVRLFRRVDVFVHAKLTLIDDVWFMAGTPNCTRRSLYTDIELAVTVLDPPVAKRLRMDLWGGHFGLSKQARGKIADLSTALTVWEPAWGTNKSGVVLPPSFAQDDLVSSVELLKTTPFDPVRYARTDLDSRDLFGAISGH